MNNQRGRLLAYVTGLVNQELLLQNEYLVAENHTLKAHLRPGFRLTDSERITLAEIGKRLERKGMAHIAKPDTLLAWHRRLIAHKFDGSKQRRSVGRPRIHTELENLVVCAWRARTPAGDTTGLWERWDWPKGFGDSKTLSSLARTILLGLDPQLEARSTRHSARSCNVACVQ